MALTASANAIYVLLELAIKSAEAMEQEAIRQLL